MSSTVSKLDNHAELARPLKNKISNIKQRFRYEIVDNHNKANRILLSPETREEK